VLLFPSLPAVLQVLLWDIRSGGSPLRSATAPGGAGVLKIAPGPWGDVLAVSSSKGLHCLELFDFGAGMSNIAGKNWY
jgi:hypothetical protein